MMESKVSEVTKVLFLAHDPGGYDAILPIYRNMTNKKKETPYQVEMMPAGELGGLGYSMSDNDILNKISNCFSSGNNMILVTGTSWHSDIEIRAIRTCKEKHIKTVSVLDYWINYKERFQDGNAYVYPDYYLVMDEMAKREAVEAGVPEDIIVIVGNPGLDRYVNMRTPRVKTGKLLFLSQPLSALYGNSWGYTEYSAFDGVIRAGKELGYQVHVKFHPKESDDMKRKYAAFSVEGAVEDLVHEYEVVVGMCTMGLLQCALMGVPIISYQPELTVHDCCITNKLGITQGAYKYEELIEQLGSIDISGDHEKPVWYDGKSTERCVNFIENLM